MAEESSVSIPEKSELSLQIHESESGDLLLVFSGRLDSSTTDRVWSRTIEALDRTLPERVVIDASEVVYCDGSGISLLSEVRHIQEAEGRSFELKGLNEAFKPALFTYTVDLGPDVSQIEIVPTATSRRYAALKIDGVEAVSGQSFVLPLKEAATPSTFSIEVVSPDRSMTRIYTVKCT